MGGCCEFKAWQSGGGLEFYYSKLEMSALLLEIGTGSTSAIKVRLLTKVHNYVLTS